MAAGCLSTFSVSANPKSQPLTPLSPSNKPINAFISIKRVSIRLDETIIPSHRQNSRFESRIKPLPKARLFPTVAAMKDPLKIMISGAPAAGKGTQCELITKKYGLVHIAAGDLLRAEIAAGSENGKRAKEHMEKGLLVPDEIVVTMVKERLLQEDAQENGWLLDGYPRSLSQATALENLGIRPDLFVVLDVPEDILVERVVGRRLDPVTGRIYHLKYSPPETEEIAARLTQRFDDTEAKTFHQNVEAVLSIYKDLIIKVRGDLPKEEVFAQIDAALSGLLERKAKDSESMATGVVL
ncbi:adenosine monophosphate kinase isoform X2 [Tasmannia lanceolata]|uniref:adenosine monophosphate kinase isoform X2 n=1 Tax=Tasmannia lanceolata TaxID=3420 RepID=UPI00406459D1